VWHKDSREALAMRERLKHDVAPALPPAPNGAVRLTGLAALSDFVAKAEPEFAANAMLCAVNQAAYLLRRQVEQQSRDFVEKGGFTERLYAARVKARMPESDRSDKSDKSEAPACARCGKPMRRRTARNGPHSGRSFWGCSDYPACKETREIPDKSDKSDRSDPSDPRPPRDAQHLRRPPKNASKP
jgi:four helix bundle suffix protein